MATSSTQSNTRTLVEAAVLLGLATLLSIFPKFDGIWANGGSITLASMLPIILVSYRHGVKWGLLTGFAFSLLQMLTGGLYLPAGGALAAFSGLMLDYILPYTVIGLGGMFRGKFKNAALELVAGTVVVLLLRYGFHVISGYVLWRSLADATKFLSTPGFSLGDNVVKNNQGESLLLLYSLIYNGSYMLPELLITSLGALAISPVAKYSQPKGG